ALLQDLAVVDQRPGGGQRRLGHKVAGAARRAFRHLLGRLATLGRPDRLGGTRQWRRTVRCARTAAIRCLAAVIMTAMEPATNPFQEPPAAAAVIAGVRTAVSPPGYRCRRRVPTAR